MNEVTVAPAKHTALSNQAMRILCHTVRSLIGLRSSDGLCGSRTQEGKESGGNPGDLRGQTLRRSSVHREESRKVGADSGCRGRRGVGVCEVTARDDIYLFRYCSPQINVFTHSQHPSDFSFSAVEYLTLLSF